jgi:hypothetical protein
MSNCRICTAPITWALVDDNGFGERVPLDDHEQLDYGPRRYRMVRDGNPPFVAAVGEDHPGRLYVDHRHLCQQPRAL